MMKYKVSNKKRFTVILICLCLFLLVSVGGTLAYLFTSGGSVKNIFTPAQVSTFVEETLTKDGQKEDIMIRNTGNTTAYIRVAVVQNWIDAEGNVIPGKLPALPALASDWKLGNDGFYYYTSEVAAGASTGELFATAISENNAPAGAHLQVSILADGIQSKGTKDTDGIKAVVDAWGVDPSSLK